MNKPLASILLAAALCAPACSATAHTSRICAPIIPSAAHDDEGAMNWIAETTHDIDYARGEWRVQDAEGAPYRVLGYSAEEDSTIYATRYAARFCPAY